MRSRTPPKQVWICHTHGGEFVDYHDHAYCHTEPTTKSRITTQRCCNGCGRELGDITDLERQCVDAGRPLPDVRGECRSCAVDTAELLGDAQRPRGGVVTRVDGSEVEVLFVPTATPRQFLAVTVDGDSVLTQPGDIFTVGKIKQQPPFSIMYRVEQPGAPT